MSAASKGHTSANGGPTRASNEHEAVCDASLVDKTELSNAVEEFDK